MEHRGTIMDNLVRYIRLLPISTRKNMRDFGLRRDSSGWYVLWEIYDYCVNADTGYELENYYSLMDEVLHRITGVDQLRVRSDGNDVIWNWHEKEKMYNG